MAGVTELSLCMPFYKNQGVLRKHLSVFMREWSDDLRQRVEVVITDDGSPADEAAAPVIRELWAAGGDKYLTMMPRLRVFRVLEDRPWHQHGATNLAVHVAESRWVLKTDIDHIAPPSTLHEVLRLIPTMRSREVLTLGRVDAPMGREWRASEWRNFEPTRRGDGSLKPHPNSFCVSRKRYKKLKGYDERYCGLYGTDQEFRTRLFGGNTITHHLADAPLIRVSREVIPDASTRDVLRKDEPGRAEAKKAIAARIAAEGGPPLVLNFEWERVI